MSREREKDTPEELEIKHKKFDELYAVVDAAVRGCGSKAGISPQQDDVKVSIPPSAMSRCEWDLCDLGGLTMSGNQVVKIDINVGPIRLGKNKGRKREEVVVTMTWENPKRNDPGEPNIKSRELIITACHEREHRDLWVKLPELKMRWSLFQGFVKYEHEMGGIFVPTGLPPGIDEVTETMFVYSLMTTITGAIENLSRLKEMTRSRSRDSARF